MTTRLPIHPVPSPSTGPFLSAGRYRPGKLAAGLRTTVLVPIARLGLIAVGLTLTSILVPLPSSLSVFQPAWAQTTTLDSSGSTTGTSSGSTPIEVTSDDGIEWRRDEKMYIARGNAEAIQGEDHVYGDVLVAHYKEMPEGTTKVWRMEARGHARIVSPGQTVTGGVAIYEVEKDVLVMREPPLRLETPTDVVTAKDSLEYWGAKRMAVARGDAYAKRANGDIIQADVLTGYFADQATPEVIAGSAPKATPKTAPGPATASADAAQGASQGPIGATGDLERMEAFGSVMITTAKEVVRGDRAVYDVPAGIATVVGNVTISTETDQFAGERAVMNLNTGVSTLQGGPQGHGRARALIEPSRTDSGSTTPPSP